MEENPTYVASLSNGQASKRLTKVELVNWIDDHLTEDVQKVTILRKYASGDTGGPAKRLAEKQAYEAAKAQTVH